MTDIVSPTVRSAIMAGIRSKNTQPELLLRQALPASGFRYKLHAPNLPRCPDLVSVTTEQLSSRKDVSDMDTVVFCSNV